MTLHSLKAFFSSFWHCISLCHWLRRDLPTSFRVEVNPYLGSKKNIYMYTYIFLYIFVVFHWLHFDIPNPPPSPLLVIKLATTFFLILLIVSWVIYRAILALLYFIFCCVCNCLTVTNVILLNIYLNLVTNTILFRRENIFKAYIYKKSVFTSVNRCIKIYKISLPCYIYILEF